MRTKYNRILVWSIFLAAGIQFFIFYSIGTGWIIIGLPLFFFISFTTMFFCCPNCNFPTARMENGVSSLFISKKCSNCDFHYL